MSVLDHPIAFTVPRRLSPVANWQEHTPFAMYLVSALRPQRVVELGTHYGDSYCAFCQAVAELHLPTTCFAVDTWEGDAHAGGYGPEVLDDLRGHHDPLYGSFSELVRSTFDDASSRFGAGSIDLLHIDGLHTYDAVRHDYEEWSSKVSRRGIVLLHDSARHVDGFGVWRLVEELSERHPTFEFTHGNGLALVLLGDEVPQELVALTELDERAAASVRALFAALGAGVRRAGALQRSAMDAHRRREQRERDERAAEHDRALEQRLAEHEQLVEDRLQRVEQVAAELASSRILRIARRVRIGSR